MSKKVVITSALPYVNGIKHLGNFCGSLLPADIFARYRRLLGHEVLFLCGSDEHGTPIALLADKKKVRPLDICTEYHEKNVQIFKDFGISFDYFGRSSSHYNRKYVQEIAINLEKNNVLYEKEAKNIFSVVDNKYLLDRYIEGECPVCSFSRARGDQCDACNSLLRPTDLINPYSTLSGSKDLQVRKEKHLYLRLSSIGGLDYLEQIKHTLCPTSYVITQKYLKDPVKDRCITRCLSWGVPVVSTEGKKRIGYEDKVYYVWFDAPITYISLYDEMRGIYDKNANIWINTEHDNCEVYQFMGKDNIFFHTIIFAYIIKNSSMGIRDVSFTKSFHWLQWYGDKFSTSRKRGVFLDQALNISEVDYWRWYLTRRIPESKDSNFTWNDFFSVINGDLVCKLGNFISRTLGLMRRGCFDYYSYDCITEKYSDLHTEVNGCLWSIHQSYRELRYRPLTNAIVELWSIGNLFFDKTKPWNLNKTSVEYRNILSYGLHLIYVYICVAEPIIPFSYQKTQNILCLPQNSIFYILETKKRGTDYLLSVPCHIKKDNIPERFHLFTGISEDIQKDIKEKYSL